MERTAGLLSLEEKREEKNPGPKWKDGEASLTHITFQVRSSHQKHTQRLKRQSPNHLVKVLWQKHRIPSSARNQPLEMLWNQEDWQAETPTIILDILGVQAKEYHTDEELRSLTLEALSAYPSTTWARAYTDGSAEEAAKRGGGGVFIKRPDSRPIRKSVATGQQSTNYKAEAYALLAAAQTLSQEERLPTNTVFLNDCQSILQSLQLSGGDQIFSNIRQELSLLKNKTSVTLQWIPSHCGAGPHVLQWSKDHPKKQLQNGVARTPLVTFGQKRTADIWTEEDSILLQSLDWELDTVNSSPTSTDWKFTFRRMSKQHRS